jgi:ankyrin repeat protein/truncated hemoglobin YjbI
MDVRGRRPVRIPTGRGTGPTPPPPDGAPPDGAPPGAATGGPASGVPGALRHRGGFALRRPDPGLLETLGGEPGVHRLVDELYERIAADPLLTHVFPHPAATRDGPRRFFLEWFGGDPTFSDSLQPGLGRRHQHLFVSPKGAAAWLRCMRGALDACGVPPAPVMRLLGAVAAAMVNSADVEPAALRYGCDVVQDARAGRLEAALDDVARGHTEALRRALAADPLLVRGRGRHGQSLLWVAVYKNRPEILRLLLEAGADPNPPACDPPRGEIAGNRLRPGTIVSVTPLALALKQRPKLAPLLVEHGAVTDVFTAAWLGDRAGVAGHLERHPELIDAPDPAEDVQQVTPLAHALAGGDAGVVSLLLERGAEVRAHSGKLLRIAILLDRPDLLERLLAQGADARRVDSLGPLDPATRPVAELLLAHGATVPPALLPRACRADVGRNALHRVTVLLGYGADVNGRGREGLTALHYAVRGGELPVIRCLLDHGADVAARDPDGLTPLLHLARTRAALDHVAVLELLARYGADLDARTGAGETLLFSYARRGDAPAVRWLLAHGADPRIRNDRGASAADLAERHPTVAQLLGP